MSILDDPFALSSAERLRTVDDEIPGLHGAIHRLRVRWEKLKHAEHRAATHDPEVRARLSFAALRAQGDVYAKLNVIADDGMIMLTQTADKRADEFRELLAPIVEDAVKPLLDDIEAIAKVVAKLERKPRRKAVAR